MPLPDGGKQPWPPKYLEPIYSKIATWSAWYSGEPEQLAAIYGGQSSYDTTGFFASETGGFKARVLRTMQRMFWGTRIPRGEQRTKLHIPLAGDIASTSADLLFSEPPTLTVDDDTTQARLDDLVDDGTHANLLEAAEIAAGLGGAFLRVVWDRNVSDRPWLSAVHPDAAVPEWTWGRLAAVTFWRILFDDGTDVVRHLERHEPGAILHGVYKGTADKLGSPQPLTEYTETAGIADSLDAGGNSIPTGLPNRLTAVYVPNMRPNRCWRNTPMAAPLGRADVAGTEPLMDALDETWTSWMRDLRLAKARLVVPSVYLQANGPGKGAGFDSDREIYEQLNVLPGSDGGLKMDQVQFAIRVDEHERTALALTTDIVRAAGYAAQTFGMQGDTAVTATEVAARERKSFITRDKKIRYWRPALQEIFETLLMIDSMVFGTGVIPARPGIEFGDGVSEDPTSMAQTLQMLESARAVSIDTKVRMLHPDWEDTDVDDEVQRIKDESGVGPVQDPGTFTGLPSQQQQAQGQPAGG